MSLPSYLYKLHDLAIPLVLADAIVIFSVICFNFWSSRVRKIRLSIDQLNERISTLSHITPSDLVALSEQQELESSMKGFLQETSASWMTFPEGSSQKEMTQTLFSYRAYNDIWHIRRLLKSKINLELFEAMPNLLVGFGLMCTFSFLAIALIQTGQALSASDASSLQQEVILQNLIATAGGKFIVSIAGLLCSLVWNWRIKVMMRHLQSSLDELCDAFKKIAPDNATQIFLQTQLNLLQNIGIAVQAISNLQSRGFDNKRKAY